MKVNELMIGDWVLAYGKKTQIVWVGNIHKMAVRGFPYEFIDGEIEPIPLTPEILEKNGFKYKEGETGVYGVTTAPHYICDGVPFEVFCDGEPFAIWFKEPINIKYVHQLQQALRLCGIEKEIEL